MQPLFMTCDAALRAGCGIMFLADVVQSRVGTIG